MRMNANTSTDTNMRIADNRIIERELSYALNGIFFSIHNMLGRYCNEQQYSDAIMDALQSKHVAFEREKILEPSFIGERSGRHRIDFIVEGRIVVEVKAKLALEREDFVQVLRYLQALNIKLGILVNFGTKALVPRRILNPKA
ncbi:MAG: GxxExxY protein [Candidatus Uhrbacteria bacterium]